MRLNLSKMILATLLTTLPMVSIQATDSNSVVTTTTRYIDSVESYGIMDLEGAKLAAIIVHYNVPIRTDSINANTYQVNDYTKMQIAENGESNTIEVDYDGIAGNEGEIKKVYVNTEPKLSSTGGTKAGNYVIIELNTAYMLSGQNLAYTTSMMAGATQVGKVISAQGIVLPPTKEVGDYTATESFNKWKNKNEIVVNTDKSKIILPEFGEGSGWKLHYIGKDGFKATKAYSEYTGRYYDFEMPYSIYVPSKEVLEKNKGNIAVVLHMEHAGGNDTDPMSAITSSKAAAKLSSQAIQSKHPAIIIVPQIEESRRSTDDLFASSEANTAVWELLDSVLKEYKEYINPNRIYGTGQSMGGMTILNMAAQRDNFFGGIAVVGAQWGNNYNKPYQHNNSPARTPDNDSISFNGFGLDRENYENWYYMISDDNILVHTAKGDPLASGLWQATADYFGSAGVIIPTNEWDPYLPLKKQNKKDKALLKHDNSKPGMGVTWGKFSRGTHMSTWKYGYQLDEPFEWLFQQSRKTEMKRGKLNQLKNLWAGRDNNGKVNPNSGTTLLNTAQYTPNGASKVYVENWTPQSVKSNTVVDNNSKK